MYKEVFATRIKNARNNTGLSQREVAKETNIPYSTISKYENGTIEPDLERLGTLASFYNVTTDWLLGIGPQTNKENLKQEKYLNDLEKTIKKEVRQDKKKIAT